MNKAWTVTVEEDEDGNAILPLPKEMIDELGWLNGDILDMDIEGDTVIVKNITCDERKGKVV
jgi:hypothetical protein